MPWAGSREPGLLWGALLWLRPPLGAGTLPRMAGGSCLLNGVGNIMGGVQSEYV